MKFWRKFWLILLTIATLIALELWTKEIGRFEISIGGQEFSIGIYVICISLLSFWFICFALKSFFVWFLSLFIKDKTAEEIKSIGAISKLIVADDYEFTRLFERTPVVENLKILKIALALKRNLKLSKNFEKTGIHCIDIFMIKKDLQSFVSSGDLNSAITLANKAIRNYYEEIAVVQDEILEIAKRARYGSVSFSFDPAKFKYNLSQSFINKYHIELEMVNFEIADETDKKLRIIERLHKDYPANIEILCKFLDFVFENISKRYEEKKILDAISQTLCCNPNRIISKYLLKIKRNDIFEFAQSAMTSIPDNNIEKLWLLLNIAMDRNFQGRIRELITKIIDVDKSDDIYKLFTCNFEALSADPEIINIIRKGRS